MNVPKPLRFEVDPGTVLKIFNVFICILFTHTVRMHKRIIRILRHVPYHSAAKHEKETSQLAAGS